MPPDRAQKEKGWGNPNQNKMILFSLGQTQMSWHGSRSNEERSRRRSGDEEFKLGLKLKGKWNHFPICQKQAKSQAVKPMGVPSREENINLCV
jgi:hypothetical protein